MRSRVSADDFRATGRVAKGPAEGGVWPVCEEYELRGDEIVSRFDYETFERWRHYQPLEEAPNLFLTFAKLYEAPNFEEAALLFTRKYGLPDGREKDVLGGLTRTVPDKLSLPQLREESRRAWVVLALYESVLNGDAQAAGSLIRRHRSEKGMTFWFNYLDMQASRNITPPPELTCALLGSVTMAKETSDELCRQQIAAFPTKAGDLNASCLRVSWIFDNLLGAMYLQMYWLMSSAGDLTRCENCGRIISLARIYPEGRKHRRDKRFCDDACRQANHRSKKKT